MKFEDLCRGASISVCGRPGKPPLWVHCPNEDKGVAEVLAWLERVTKKYIGTLVAVVCSSMEESRYVHSLLTPTFGNAVRLGTEDDFTFEEGIVVTDPRQIKGLEFPHVLLWNPSAKNYPATQQARNQLYVAVTRCEDHLCLVSWATPASFLPPLNSKLVRGVDMRESEE